MLTRRLLFKCLPWLVLVLAGTPARAQLLDTCTTVTITVSALSFSYLPASPAQNSTNVKISCGLGLFVLPNITVALTAGNAGSFTPRQMSDGGADRLNYNLYTTSGYATVWGDGTNGTVTQNVSGSLIGQASYTFTAYGLVPAGQYVTATTYTDEITVQVTF